MSMRHADMEEIIKKTQREWLEEVGGKSVTEAMKQIKEHYRNLTDADLAKLRERIEELESRASSPGKVATGPREVAWKTYHTPHGPLYEVPYDVKVADVLGEKKAEMPLTRWLPAAIFGEAWADAEAVKYAMSLKQLATTTSGLIIPQIYMPEWIDLIRSQQVLNAAGQTTLVMDAKTVNASAVASDPAASWHTESGSISADNPTFAARSLTAQTLVVRCNASLEATQDSPDFGRQLTAVMSKSMAVELDKVGLVGSGTPPEPRGILNTSGRKQVTSVGSITDYTDLLSGLRKLLDSNLSLDVAAGVAIMSPGVWLAFESLVTGLTSDKSQLMRPKSLENTRFLITTNGLDVGSPLTSTIFMGDFSDLVLGLRKEASIEVIKASDYPGKLVLDFIGYLRADYLVRRPASFVTLEGVAPAP